MSDLNRRTFLSAALASLGVANWQLPDNKDRGLLPPTDIASTYITTSAHPFGWPK
jgi:hypothetical protein